MDCRSTTERVLQLTRVALGQLYQSVARLDPVDEMLTLRTRWLRIRHGGKDDGQT